jgi:lipase ATG15
MRRLCGLVLLLLVFTLVYSKQHPLKSSAVHPPQRQLFSAVGILDVGVGPPYREYKRWLPVSPSSLLYTTLHHDDTFNIRPLTRNRTQHVSTSREAINHAITQTRLSKYTAQSAAIPWKIKEIVVPDVTDLITVTTLAQIANNAYIEIPKTFDWIDVNKPWNLSSDFGWEKNGLRGHVYANDNNETIIISLKGTSPAVFLGGGTGGNDKINDNLLFSCCCAKLGVTWKPACECCSSPQVCNSTCIESELASEAHYYQAALEIYYTINDAFPNSNIWITGHSLGGALAALTGLTFAAPTVTFCAPGDRLAAGRLHLPSPPGVNPEEQLTWHFGHTADPIYTGTCTVFLST